MTRLPPSPPISDSLETPSRAYRPLSDDNAGLLFKTGVIGVVGLALYFGLTAQVEDPLHRYQGLAMLFLAALPALLWARRQDTSFPIFQTFMITGINSFALPLLGGHELLNRYPPSSVSAASWGVILFQACALISYHLVQGLPRTSPWWTTPLFQRSIDRYLRIGMVVTTLYGAISRFTTIIPVEMVGVSRAVVFGVGILCTFLMSRAWGTGDLSLRDKGFFCFMLGLQVIFLISSLFLVGAVSIIILALLGYISGGKRLPIVALVAIFLTLAVLHNGKSAMRMKYWEGDKPLPTIFQLPEFFAEWVTSGLQSPDSDGGRERRFASLRLIERTSLLHMMTLVVDATPARQPFLDGETYTHIIPQLIPRLFWPDKPIGHVSTQRLATYYGLQTEEDTLKTTIGFGMLVEAYSNFGYIGLAVLGIVIGTLSKLAGIWSKYSPLVSYPGLLMVLLMAWSFQIELPLSAWLSSLYQATLAVLGVPFLVKLFFD
ncbi:MAG TPA: hypothetical protein PLN52_22565 [Opitutaceae bacterium]|nr:hypothetical protein [Opitutaceae bacterium]